MFTTEWAHWAPLVAAGQHKLEQLFATVDLRAPANGQTPWGRESEFLAFCKVTGQPAPIVADLLRLTEGTNANPDAVEEVLRAMFELNGPVMQLQPGSLGSYAATERERILRYRKVAHLFGSEFFSGGMCPGMGWEHLSQAWYVPKKRYLELQHGLSTTLGNDGKFKLCIPSMSVPSNRRLQREVTFTVAGAVFAEQIQVRLSPLTVGAQANWAHVFLGPLCALFSNATCFNGELLDSASARPQWWSCITSVPGFRRRYTHFFDKWLPENDDTAFLQWMRLFQNGDDAIVDCTSDDPLTTLKLYCSKWPWVRPKVDTLPYPNIRMELRGADKQCSVEDGLAYFALVLGALHHVVKKGLNVRDIVTPTQARHNFLQGAHYGTLRVDPQGNPQAEHGLSWRGQTATAREIVRHDILPWAIAGLRDIGFEMDEINAALYPVHRMAVEGAPGGAEWIRVNHNRITQADSTLTPAQVGRILTTEMATRSWDTTQPICDWRPISM